MNFRENFKKDMKKCDHHIADLRKQLASRHASVEKVRGQGNWRTAGGLRDRSQLWVSQQKLLSLMLGWWWGGVQGAPTSPYGRQNLLPRTLR